MLFLAMTATLPYRGTPTCTRSRHFSRPIKFEVERVLNGKNEKAKFFALDGQQDGKQPFKVENFLSGKFSKCFFLP